MYINKEKETKRELETLKKYTNPETLSTAKIANQVRDNTKRIKKLFQVDYEEKITNNLQAEKNKNRLLQEELDRLHISFQVLNAMYDHNVPKIRKQADAFQHGLDNKLLQKNILQSDFDEATAAPQEETKKNKTLQEHMDKMSATPCGQARG
ncbi:hypothetical protein GBF38_012769 [Nibea albiflora]|uniref:Uncharacterized protein n=1 Tax=Nibea albiflora TaxID=240163 RepID=A0ACB7EJL9_NIBAL|nr:hypothetical protein GBF38_012769 [Nibea albiflora]